MRIKCKSHISSPGTNGHSPASKRGNPPAPPVPGRGIKLRVKHHKAMSPEELKEIARREQQRKWEQIADKVVRAIDAIQWDKGDSMRPGKIPCPNCGGTLYYSVAQNNGHIAAKCEGSCGVRFIQ